MTFTDSEAWKEARQPVKVVDAQTVTFPKDELYGLQSQNKRSVISIPSNITVGCGCSYLKDCMRFFFIARGSAYELETQIYLAYDLGFINEIALKFFTDKPTKIRMLLAGLINYQKSQIVN